MLAEAPRGIAFRTAAGRFHATRVISRRRAGVTLGTNDPSGRRIELRLARDAAGVIGLDARPTAPASRRSASPSWRDAAPAT